MELSDHVFELILAIGGGLFTAVATISWHIIRKLSDTLLANTTAMIEMKVVVAGMKDDILQLKGNNPIIEKLRNDMNIYYERLRALEQFNQKEI